MAELHLVQMEKHFLYLPLYYARAKNFFGYLHGHELKIVDSFEKTDESAFERLMTPHAGGNEKIAFALADPACALMEPTRGDRTAAVVGGLITTAAFWAVDRGKRRLIYLRDMSKFDKVIAFKNGSTSYGIATRILRDASKSNDNIIPVDPGRELQALTYSKPGTVALTPDILKLTHLLRAHSEYNIELSLSTTPEYSNVLVTSILSRRDIMDKYPEFTIGLLQALQKALTLVRMQDEDVIHFAHEHFNSEKEVVRIALDTARMAQVYPADLEVTQVNWNHAARACSDARGIPFDEAAEEHAVQLFDSIVEPYRHFSRKSWRLVLSRWGDAETNSLPTLTKRAIASVATIATGGVLASVGGWWLLSAVIVLASLAWALDAVLLKLGAGILQRRMMASIWVLTILLVSVGKLMSWGADILVGMSLTALVGAIGIIAQYLYTKGRVDA